MRRRTLALVVLAALYALHQDVWLWDEGALWLGLPAGLAYHLGYCLVTAGVMAWLARGIGDGRASE